jgi:predicted component of type VI protein secretion system
VLDKKLTDQVNLIMHDPHFQAVEGHVARACITW